MEMICVYPASFCPPTFGHLHTVQKAAEIFPKIMLVCSINPNKYNNWFTPAECRLLWRSYKLPSGVSVETLETAQAKITNMSQVVMIRGIRNKDDAEYEKRVMLYNKERFKINKYFYLFCNDGYEHISSSRARFLAENLILEELSDYVSFLVISRLLEKVLKIKNLFMVVGKPGAGKSTFLKILQQENTNNVFINTDNFNRILKPLLKQKFRNRDLVKIALTQKEELKNIIAQPWIELLKKSLRQLPEGCNAFVEIPFGLQEDKKLYHLLGGKIIYVDCGDGFCEKRIIERSTPELLPFVSKIPGLKQTQKIVQQNNLNLIIVKTAGSLRELKEKAKKFNDWLGQEETQWKTSLPGLSLVI